MRRFQTAIALAVLLAGCSFSKPAPPIEPAGDVPLFAGLGDRTRKVTTDSRQAQQYFDQGLSFMYADTGVSRSAAMSNGDSMLGLPVFLVPKNKKPISGTREDGSDLDRERTRVFYARTTHFAGDSRHQRPFPAG